MHVTGEWIHGKGASPWGWGSGFGESTTAGSQPASVLSSAAPWATSSIGWVRQGAVADFIDVHWGIYHWRAFNVADSAITVGVCILLIDTLPIRRGRASVVARN